jgi:small subunit ribosomal protein S10
MVMPSAVFASGRAPVRARPAVAARQVQCQAGLRLKIKLKAYNKDLLDQAVELVNEAIADTGARCRGPAYLPTRRRIYCVLRSPHVNSNSREHFEIRTHQRLIHVQDVTKEAVQSMMAVVMPAGVETKISV